MRRILIGVAVVLTAALTYADNPPVKITVSPTISFAPSDVRVIIQIEPHPDNRQACLIYDSDEGQSGHSCWEVDGESRRTTTKWLKGLSKGQYEAQVRVLRVGGEEKVGRGMWQVEGR